MIRSPVRVLGREAYRHADDVNTASCVQFPQCTGAGGAALGAPIFSSAIEQRALVRPVQNSQFSRCARTRTNIPTPDPINERIITTHEPFDQHASPFVSDRETGSPGLALRRIINDFRYSPPLDGAGCSLGVDRGIVSIFFFVCSLARLPAGDLGHSQPNYNLIGIFIESHSVSIGK